MTVFIFAFSYGSERINSLGFFKKKTLKNYGYFVSSIQSSSHTHVGKITGQDYIENTTIDEKGESPRNHGYQMFKGIFLYTGWVIIKMQHKIYSLICIGHDIGLGYHWETLYIKTGKWWGLYIGKLGLGLNSVFCCFFFIKCFVKLLIKLARVIVLCIRHAPNSDWIHFQF